MVSGLAAQYYESRLKELNLWTLEKKEKNGWSSTVFQIVHGIGKVECLSDNLNLPKPAVKTELRRELYSVRVVGTNCHQISSI